MNVCFEETVVFYDAGGNMESVSCPACNADTGRRWGDAMDNAVEAGFRDLTITTSCCSTRTSLNALDHDWPAAFGRFCLEVVNPGRPSLAEPTRTRIEQLLGTKLTLVWQRL